MTTPTRHLPPTRRGRTRRGLQGPRDGGSGPGPDPGQPPDGPAPPTLEETEPDAGSRPTQLVLVVEDDPTFAKLLTQYLRQSQVDDYQSIVADTVRTAVRRLADDAFDVIIADLGLPDSSAYDTIESLAQAAPEVPIVVLTGTAEEGLGSSLEAVRRGASYFLRKGTVDAAAVERGIRYAKERRDLQALLDRPDT